MVDPPLLPGELRRLAREVTSRLEAELRRALGEQGDPAGDGLRVMWDDRPLERRERT